MPPPNLPGLHPSWSRLVTTPALDGSPTWHVLDTHAQQSLTDVSLTLLCVHGNPSWSYLWRKVLAAAPTDVRVIAVDHLDMGFSERTGRTRRLAERVSDLGALTDELDVSTPVVTIAHDWGGPISLGWALDHRQQLAGVVLTNTAVHQPAGAAAPAIIRLVRSTALLQLSCVTTTSFVRGAHEMCRPRLPAAERAAYLSPYQDADRRRAIGDFVLDIPLESDHPSAPTLDRIAAGLAELTDIPAFLLWGPNDPVFSDLYLADLRQRLPHADVHRFVGAAHFVTEDADVVTPIYDWVQRAVVNDPATPTVRVAPPVPARTRLWENLTVPSGNDIAIAEIQRDTTTEIRWADLHARIEAAAAGMAADGIRAGDRVALLVPPGIDLSVAVYACWRLGAIVVLVDGGLGAAGISRALRSARPDHLIGIPRALTAARAMRWPGRRIAAGPLTAQQRAAGATVSLPDLIATGQGKPLPNPPAPDAMAAVVFTSGSTGPSKGVRYRHHQIEAQRDALMAAYSISPADRLVAAFAPFALYGPAMGIASAVPDMDITAPSSLTASALADAARAIDATLVFASPTALTNMAATAGTLGPLEHEALASVRLVLSAGAPVSIATLESAVALMPNAAAHTPYGMTEVLPVADISLVERLAVGPGTGVCVGAPVPGVDVAVVPLDELDAAPPSSQPNLVGEICIRAAHLKDGYDHLSVTEAASKRDGWHRSGDVGHLDDAGRLWIEGRVQHVIATAAGPITPVGIEQAAESVAGVAQAATVGVGPAGAQVVVVVVVPSDMSIARGVAPLGITDDVRAAAQAADDDAPDIAAVLIAGKLPVDRRHNAKVDRQAVAAWAARVLAGQRLTRLDARS